MSTFLRPQTGGRKGIAQFAIVTEQTGVTTGTAINIFEETTTNTSTTIVKSSNTQVILKAGKTYKLQANLRLISFSAPSVEHQFQFYNATTGSYIGTGSNILPLTNGSDISIQPTPVALISTSTDTVIELRDRTASGTASVFGGTVRQSHITIEELEEFIPQANGSTSIQGDLTVSGGIKLPGTAPAAGTLNSTISTVKTSGNVTGPSSAGTYVDISSSITVPPGYYEAKYYVTLQGKAATPDIVLTACIRDGSNNIVTNSQTSALVQNADSVVLFCFVPVTVASETTFKLSATANIGYSTATIWNESLTSTYSDENRARLTFKLEG